VDASEKRLGRVQIALRDGEDLVSREEVLAQVHREIAVHGRQRGRTEVEEETVHAVRTWRGGSVSIAPDHGACPGSCFSVFIAPK
jgi:hypothetical protein